MNAKYDYIYFDQAVTELSNVTINFTSPSAKVTFDKDQSTYTVSSYGSPTEFTTAEAHNLSTGDQVEISDFSTDDTTTDATAISSVNATHTATVNSTTTFTINVDTSSVSPTSGLMGKVYYESKRIFIPMHIIFIKPGKDR
jgi:protein involved in polysaccharide export with SLBB domain